VKAGEATASPLTLGGSVPLRPNPGEEATSSAVPAGAVLEAPLIGHVVGHYHGQGERHLSEELGSSGGRRRSGEIDGDGDRCRWKN
jgi:hypothetical protein